MVKSSAHQAIAIIGGGFSGAMVAVHLLRNATHPLTITLIERRPVVGQGAAYSTSFDCHLLNVPAAKMSAFPDDEDHFVRWLATQPQITADATTFVSRKHYGAYIQSILAEAEAKAASGVRLERLIDEAIAIYPQTEGALVRLQSGLTVQADQVVLALGNFAPADVPVANRAFYQSDRYVTAWSASVMQALPRDESLLLIGSGLTTLDWIVALNERGHQGTIHVISRRGLLPQPHRLTMPSSIFAIQGPFSKTVLGLLRQVREAVDVADSQGQDWRSVMDGLRPHAQEIWRSLSLTEQRRFLRHLRPYWDTHRHRIAPHVAERVAALLKSGQVMCHAGRIYDYQKRGNGIDVLIRPRGRTEAIALSVGLVVNCTGPACNYRTIQHPLIASLLNENLIQPNSLSLGLEVTATGALIGADGPSDWLFTLGSPKRGHLWETTAITELRVQAIALAHELLTLPQQLQLFPSGLTAQSLGQVAIA